LDFGFWILDWDLVLAERLLGRVAISLDILDDRKLVSWRLIEQRWAMETIRSGIEDERDLYLCERRFSAIWLSFVLSLTRS
jgi:hypothetical protein